MLRDILSVAKWPGTYSAITERSAIIKVCGKRGAIINDKMVEGNAVAHDSNELARD